MHLIALVSLVGDHAAATVLSQIMYWHKGRLRVHFNGKLWLAKSRVEMCQETGITLDQVQAYNAFTGETGLDCDGAPPVQK